MGNSLGPGPAPKIPKTLCNLLRNPVEPDLALHGSAPKPPGTFSGTFSETLLNLTWLCTKASQAFSGTEPDLPLHQGFPGVLRNLLRNPVEPDLALHQSLPDLLLTRHLHQCTPELFWAEDPISLRCWGINPIPL